MRAQLGKSLRVPGRAGPTLGKSNFLKLEFHLYVNRIQDLRWLC